MNGDRLRSFVRDHWFGPGVIGLLTNPFYLARSALERAVRALAWRVKGKVLDVGCGLKPYRNHFATRTYFGLECGTGAMREKSADVTYDGRLFPFRDASFDTVIANQVLEHVFTPDEFLEQLHRILGRDGGLLLTVPFVWDEHEQPIDYGRYTSFGLRSILERHHFEVVELRKSAADTRVIFQLINCYVYKRIHSWPTVLRLPVWMLVTPLTNITGALFGALLPTNEDLYLDNVVFARKVTTDA